ncbi:MAG: hypothetical protein IT320_01230 [Anaerolineae bacterium]|nr:hypothetical protein [Anaerolineae bacterium]
MATSRNSKKGRSLLRNIIIIAVIGAILIGGGALSFFADRASHQAPLNVDPYPGAELWGYGDQTRTSRLVYYKIRDASPEVVAEYYQDKLSQHSNGTQDQCVRLPEIGEFPASDLGPGLPPYRYVCHFDNSGFQATQYTKVTISPGLYNADPEYNTEGLTVVQYEQAWQS